MPRYLKKSNDGNGPAIRYEPNSNLEQVSDWLTKIIVGVGLIKIRQLIAGLGWLADQLGTAFGDPVGSSGAGAIYGLGLSLAATFIGFLLTYMWAQTRLYDVLDGNAKGQTSGAMYTRRGRRNSRDQSASAQSRTADPERSTDQPD